MSYFDDYSVWIDGSVLVILFFSGVFALSRGLVRESLGLASWILAALAVFYAIPASRPYTENSFESRITADIVVGVTVAISVLVVCTLITYCITRRIRTSPLSGLDRILGLGFGLVRGVLIALAVYMLASFNFSREMNEEAEHSFFRPHLERVADAVLEYFSNYGREDNNLDELFEKLNTPEVKPPEKEEFEPLPEKGYKKQERESLDRLILETSEDEDFTDEE